MYYKMTSKSYKRLKDISNDKIGKHDYFEKATEEYNMFNTMMFFLLLFLIAILATYW